MNSCVHQPCQRLCTYIHAYICMHTPVDILLAGPASAMSMTVYVHPYIHIDECNICVVYMRVGIFIRVCVRHVYDCACTSIHTIVCTSIPALF